MVRENIKMNCKKEIHKIHLQSLRRTYVNFTLNDKKKYTVF